VRIICIGAHPDDCEIGFGAAAYEFAEAGHAVRFLSVTNGAVVHHLVPRVRGDTPALRHPLFLYLEDGFQQPAAFVADVAVAIDDVWVPRDDRSRFVNTAGVRSARNWIKSFRGETFLS